MRERGAVLHEDVDETEQRLFSRLAVFVGGFTLVAAEQVCDADLDTIASLVEKSLVRQGEERFRMLETIREFALERLEESGERDHIRRRHLEVLLELARHKESTADRQAPEWLERLEVEHDNFRAALQVSRGLDDPRLELRLASSLADFWEHQGHLTEGLERIREALDRDPDGLAEDRGPALLWGTMIALKQGDLETAQQLAEKKKQLHTSLEDESGAARGQQS